MTIPTFWVFLTFYFYFSLITYYNADMSQNDQSEAGVSATGSHITVEEDEAGPSIVPAPDFTVRGRRPVARGRARGRGKRKQQQSNLSFSEVS
jgi:hypothetical protein